MRHWRESLQKSHPSWVKKMEFDDKSRQTVIQTTPENLVAIVSYLKQDLQFDILMDLFAIDWHKKKTPRFEMNYLFYSTAHNDRAHLRVALANDKKPEIDTITHLYGAADWAEREVYDMFGIHVKDHPNLKRLLMWEKFEGHPLRKDYPYNKRQPIPEVEELL